MKNKTWLIAFLSLIITIGIIIGAITIYVDPYMHYHKPLTKDFYYELDNQRSQNYGIIKQFKYDTIITGTSMSENFYSTEVDKLFNCNSIKIPFSGASFKEINNNLEKALSINPNIRYIIRGFDLNYIDLDKNYMRTDLGEYPVYLYDNNPFNDVNYLLNKSILIKISKMLLKSMLNYPTGITSFDEYSNWMSSSNFGNSVVLKTFESENRSFRDNEQTEILTNQLKKMIKENIEQNILSIAEKYPKTKFYYFITPYSAAYWGIQKDKGTLLKQIKIIEYAISLMLPYENIHLFGWNRFDLFDDLNNYKDPAHYGEWINSWILSQMKKESGKLTNENYMDYINDFKDHYMNFDFNTLFYQVDYEADYYSAAILNKEISGIEPLVLDISFLETVEIKNAQIIINQFEGSDGIECYESKFEITNNTNEATISDGNFCGIKFNIDVTDYRCLVFYGKKVSKQAQHIIHIYDDQGNLLKKSTVLSNDLDNQWHQYAISLAGIYGEVTIIMDGRNIDNSNTHDSNYIFSNIVLY
ncbi:MAG: hypothetical protein ACOX1F_04110 [Erysipelotrichaceae bacterium]